MSWSCDQILDLRNRAAARAHKCEPIVRESEELMTLIHLLDKALLGGPLPGSLALGELQALAVEEQAPVPSVQARGQRIKAVSSLLAGHREQDFGAEEVASLLGIPYKTAKWALLRLLEEGSIERPTYGRYCYRKRQLAA
jgi:hypothetical protein